MHMVCCNCRNWVQVESSGCGKTWDETRGESFACMCKGCTEVKVLVKSSKFETYKSEITENVYANVSLNSLCIQ